MVLSLLTVSRSAQARALDQVQNSALAGSEQMIYRRMAFAQERAFSFKFATQVRAFW